MKKEVKIFTIIGMVVLLASCSNYKYLSDNDVYSQKPTAINLQEDETDLTSYNAYVARAKGEFNQEYRDPRMTYRYVGNGFITVGGFMPVYNYGGVYYGTGMPYGRAGMYNPYFYNPYYRDPFSGFHYAYNPYSGYPMSYYGNYNSPYYGGGYYNGPYGPGYGYGYNPYYHGGGYYGGGNYYGNGGNGYNPNTSSYSEPVYYGKRNGNSGSSKRPTSGSSSSQTKTLVTTGTPFNANNQTNGTSRRSAGMAQSGGGQTPYSQGYTNSSVQNNNTSYNTARRSSYQTVHRSSAQTNYTPNKSMRSSNNMNVRRSNVSTGVSRSGYNTSSSSRRQGVSIQASPSSRGSISVGGSVRSSSPSSSVRSSPSSTSNSSGTSRRSSGGR